MITSSIYLHFASVCTFIILMVLYTQIFLMLNQEKMVFKNQLASFEMFGAALLPPPGSFCYCREGVFQVYSGILFISQLWQDSERLKSLG